MCEHQITVNVVCPLQSVCHTCVHDTLYLFQVFTQSYTASYAIYNVANG